MPLLALLADTCSRSLLGKRNDFVDDTILLRLRCTHEEIAVGIALNTFKRLSSMPMDNSIDLIAQVEDLACMNLDVGCLPA